MEAFLRASRACFWAGLRVMRGILMELVVVVGWSLAAVLGVRAAGSRSLATVGRGER